MPGVVLKQGTFPILAHPLRWSKSSKVFSRRLFDLCRSGSGFASHFRLGIVNCKTKMFSNDATLEVFTTESAWLCLLKASPVSDLPLEPS